MSNNYLTYQSGLGSVGAYQLAGIPWASSSISAPSGNTPTEVAFPLVTKSVTIKNLSSNPLRVGFSAAGTAGSNYYIVGGSETVTLDTRVTKLYLLALATATSASVMASLTPISAGELPNSWSGSAGIG
jgi:hypothetical protein